VGRDWLAKPRPAVVAAGVRLAANQHRGRSSGAEQPASNRQVRVRLPAPAPVLKHRCGVVEWPQTPAFEAGGHRFESCSLPSTIQAPLPLFIQTSVAQRQERDFPKVEAGGSSPPGRSIHPFPTTGHERRPTMHHPHHSHVLQLDIQGTPQAWISLEHAAAARGHGLGGVGGRRRPAGHAARRLQRRARAPVGHRRAPDHGAARRVQGQPVRCGARVQQEQAVPARPHDLRVLRPALSRARPAVRAHRAGIARRCAGPG
jgi:hypothetical protein